MATTLCHQTVCQQFSFAACRRPDHDIAKPVGVIERCPNGLARGFYDFHTANPGIVPAIRHDRARRPVLPRSSAAQSDARKTDLNLLWQEWQVISQARLLFVKLVQAQKLMAVLEDTQIMFADRVRRTRSALARGLLTSDAVKPNLTALQDVERQVFELKRQIAQNARELNALLGLAPGTVLHLREGADFAEVDAAAVDAVLSDLPLKRAIRPGADALNQPEQDDGGWLCLDRAALQ